MGNDEHWRRDKILTAAASRGWHADVYLDLCRRMEGEGLIVLRATRTAVGNIVMRWFLA